MEITKVNAPCDAPRTIKRAKDKWRNLTFKVKSTFAEYGKEVNKTGGGPSPKKPTSSVESISNMLQHTASFSGIEGDLETKGFTNEQNSIMVYMVL